MKFSVKTQSFYDDGLSYGENLPDDAIEITMEEYTKLFGAVNSSRYIFIKDGALTISEERPSKYYTWDELSQSWKMTDESKKEKEEDDLLNAENQKAALINSAKNTISVWQTELQLGIISDADKASLIKWITYIKQVQAIDTAAAPLVTWPDPPTTEAS